MILLFSTNQLNPMSYCMERVSKKEKKGNTVYCDLIETKDKKLEITTGYSSKTHLRL